MTPRPELLLKYLRTRSLPGPWQLEGCSRHDFACAVVIPALAESEHLFATLASLAANPPELLERFLVLVVVNHREDAAEADKADNLTLLRRLGAGDGVPPGLNLAWVDAASPGRELPAKWGGVGLARKIGFDLALPRLDYTGPSPVLVSLDADTLVDGDYLAAILDHFRRTREGGAVLPFRHQPGATPLEEAAIGRYELFLRHFVLGLSLAASPYAFHSIGSAFACSAPAYVKAGGMNRRTAGEDFYFLQQLAKTTGVARLTGTTVLPASRPSLRTPFGTGRSVARLLDGDTQAVRFYPPAVFVILGGWLTLATEGWEEPGEVLLDRARSISAHLASYLAEQNFPDIWDRLRRQHRRREALVGAFHGWFDALRSLQLIHHLCACEHPRIEAEQAISSLLERAGLEPTVDPARQLHLLRGLQE
jgi:hypothetical protein